MTGGSPSHRSASVRVSAGFPRLAFGKSLRGFNRVDAVARRG
jgi:hypothetical protein